MKSKITNLQLSTTEAKKQKLSKQLEHNEETRIQKK